MSATTKPVPTTKLGFDPTYLPAFEDKLFIEGPQTARRLTNFFALLIFATVIATYGVLSDSTATVIGAMIVAPLMSPIMATTSAVVMGSMPRALRAFGLTVAGILTVILLSFVLSWVVPSVTISFESNGEITSRINPGVFALLTALGAGAAGAFITSRAEIADSMGGVAIAISLVPPLCVVGIALQQGKTEAVAGALLLFFTNYLAILFAGGIVLIVLGLSRETISREQLQIRRRGFVLFTAGILLVTIPLSITGYRAIQIALENRVVTEEVQEWLRESSYHLVDVHVGDRVVITTIEGFGDLRPLQQLADRVADALNRPIIVNVRTVPAQVSASGSP